jgi:cytoskeletal protein RodZ
MRSDVTLYIVATFFFILAITTAVLFTDITRVFWVSFTIILGILFIIAGYAQGPITKKPIKTLPPAIPTESPSTENIVQETPIVEEVSVEDVSLIEPVSVETSQTTDAATEEIEPIKEEPTFTPSEQETIITTQNTNNDVETVSTQIVSEEAPLTSVKGVREKRAAQLNALGIRTIKELSQTSVENLTKNLRPISPKQAADMIEAAKQYLKQI